MFSFQNKAIFRFVDAHLRRVDVNRNGFCAISSVCWPTTTTSLWERLLEPFVRKNPAMLATFRTGRIRKAPSVEQLRQDAICGTTHFWFSPRFVRPFLASRGVCAVVLDRRPSVTHKVTLRGAPWHEAMYFRVVEYKANQNHFFAFNQPHTPKAVYQFTRTDTLVRKLDVLLHPKEPNFGRGSFYYNGMQ